MTKYEETASMSFDIMNTNEPVIKNDGISNKYNLKVLQKLIEKSTPKKIVEKVEELHYKNCTQQFLLIDACCPECNNIINDIEGYPFCYFCGQALDWDK